jgi:hypothetical protein
MSQAPAEENSRYLNDKKTTRSFLQTLYLLVCGNRYYKQERFLRPYHFPETPLDNLSVDSDGVVWAAGFPKTLALVHHMEDPVNHAPSCAWKIGINTGPNAFYGEKYKVQKVLLPHTNLTVFDNRTLGRLLRMMEPSPRVLLQSYMMVLVGWSSFMVCIIPSSCLQWTFTNYAN